MPGEPDKQSNPDDVAPPGGKGSIHDPELIREFQAAINPNPEPLDVCRREWNRTNTRSNISEQTRSRRCLEGTSDEDGTHCVGRS
jgi:hypothetical protein